MPAETHSHRSELASGDIARIVIDRLAELLGVDTDEIDPDARLRDDLDADDFVISDLFDAVEDELGERTVGFRIDDDEFSEVVTVADVIECVLARFGAAS